LPETLKRGARTRPGTTLVCGFGNPGRRDDGLGPALVARLESDPAVNKRTDIKTEARLQLNIEDALTISTVEEVIFADASTRAKPPFEFKRVRPRATLAFSTHALAPASVLALCRELYGRTPRAFLLGIRGYRWELGETLTARAGRNLDRALAFLKRRWAPGKNVDKPR
jgi:hydrogenase maturation protease